MSTPNFVTKGDNKDINLAKITLYSEHLHSRYMTIFPVMITIYVAFIVAFWTLEFEGALTPEGFAIAFLSLSTGVFLGIFRFIRTFQKNVKKVSYYLERVKEGEDLPELSKM